VLTLFETLRRLSAEGCSILYISHKLDEIRALCHVATVLRGGRVGGTAIPSRESNESLAKMMIGSDLPECHLEFKEPGEVRIDVRALSLATRDPFGTTLKDISVSVRSGEILGIAGVSGNGQKELLAALSGETMVGDAGSIVLCGQLVGTSGPTQRRRAGLRFVPEERLGRGAVPAMSLSFNALLTGSQQGMVKLGLFKKPMMNQFSKGVIGRFKVKCSGEEAVASSLSGGNLQKYIVGRETMLEPLAMVVAQPTWGVDVGAAMLIRQALIDLRNQGVALLVISEELDELFMICDRIAVIAQGRLSKALPLAETSVAQIGKWMSGQFDPVDTTAKENDPVPT
jgi:simple sugar transport system ATP-binding protein